MAAFAVRAAIFQSNREPGAIDLLACATTLPDLLVSGFVSTVQGELSELFPLEIVSTQGGGCSGVSALNYAPSQLEPCQKQTAIAVAAEFPYFPRGCSTTPNLKHKLQFKRESPCLSIHTFDPGCSPTVPIMVATKPSKRDRNQLKYRRN